MLSPSLRLHHRSLSIKTAHGPGLHAQRDDLERVTVGAAPPSRDGDGSEDRCNNLDVGQGRWGGVEIAVRGARLGMGAVGTWCLVRIDR